MSSKRRRRTWIQKFGDMEQRLYNGQFVVIDGQSWFSLGGMVLCICAKVE